MSPQRICYRKGDLFSAAHEEGVAFAHAVNCQGVWGSGIAVEFKNRYPRSFEAYRAVCLENHAGVNVGSIVGHASLHLDIDRLVGCLYTSWGYGPQRASVPNILAATATAVAELLSNDKVKGVFSPKINAGLFGVPWEYTAAIIEGALILRPDKFWFVYEK